MEATFTRVTNGSETKIWKLVNNQSTPFVSLAFPTNMEDALVRVGLEVADGIPRGGAGA